MPIDAFFCIVLSAIVIRWWWKHGDHAKRKERQRLEKLSEQMSPAERSRFLQRQHEEEELRKQGYSDELIAIILPTIDNGR